MGQHWWNGILLKERMEWNSMAEMGLRPITNKSIKLTYLLSSLLSAHPAVKKRKKRRKRETAKRREVKEKKSINYLLFHQIKFNNSMKLIVVWLMRERRVDWGCLFLFLLLGYGPEAPLAQANSFHWFHKEINSIPALCSFNKPPRRQRQPYSLSLMNQ